MPRIDPPVTADNLCMCPCHTDEIGHCEECCESVTAWNAAIDAVLELQRGRYDWDEDEYLALKRKPKYPAKGSA